MRSRFNRYELKYVLPWERCEAIIQDLAPHVAPDDHGGLGGYRTVSLYYDSPESEFFWGKVEGLKFRRKLRLRAYVDGDVTRIADCMVEIKERANRTVQKRRVAMPLDEAKALCAGVLTPTAEVEFERQLREEVYYLVLAKQLRPAAITAYQRRAFEATRARLRVTFDTEVSARVHALELNGDAENRVIVPPGWAIMEVKTDEAIPSFMSSLLAKHACALQRVSKYCLGLATLKAMGERARLEKSGIFPRFGDASWTS